MSISDGKFYCVNAACVLLFQLSSNCLIYMTSILQGRFFVVHLHLYSSFSLLMLQLRHVQI